MGLPAAMSARQSDNVIEVRGVTRYYHLKKQVVRALDGITLNVPRGTYVSILGPSGSGKSTLFNVIGGLDRPTSGDVLIDGVSLATLKEQELAYVRCMKIGYIFQTYNLIPVFTAQQNVAIPMIFAGMTEGEAARKAAAILQRVGLGDRLQSTPDRLSGGQQQRVAIARALANDPSIILADEPTGNLDKQTGADIIALLNELCRQYGVTVVSATHDLKMISCSDYIAWIRDGKLDRFEDRRKVRIKEGHM